MPDWLTPAIREQILEGALITIGLTVLTSILALTVGTIAALARRSTKPAVRRPATVAIELFRNVPALIWVIFFAFAVPKVLPPDARKTVFFDNPAMDFVGDITGLPLPYYAIGAGVALVLNTGAHLAEIIRSGMHAVPIERLEAARSLGATSLTAARTVLVPDAIALSFPAISNRLVHNLKNTALASFVAVPDLFGAIQGSITKTFRASELLVIAAVMYLLLSSGLALVLRLIESRLWRGRTLRRELGV